MSDLVVFVGILVIVVAVGIAIGIIVAGRIDRILAPAPRPAAAAPDDATAEASAGPEHARTEDRS